MEEEKFEAPAEDEEEEAREAQIARLGPLLLNACMKNEQDAILGLLQENADPLIEDHRQWSPLMWAACHGNEELARVLIEKGCAGPYVASEKKTKKHSPLHWASYKGHLPVMWLLLKENLSPTEKDVLGNTVLHQGAAGGNLQVVKCLLAQGVDVFAKNERGHTPFDLCTVPPVQRLLKDSMDCRACQLTGKQFSGTVFRYYCSWTHVVVCSEAVFKMWVFVDAEATEKEKPMSLSREARDIVLEAEGGLERALADAEGKKALESLLTVKTALEKAEGKPVDVKLLRAAHKLRDKLEARIRLDEAMADENIIENTVERIVEADGLAVASDRLGKCIEDAKLKGVELLEPAMKLRRRLNCECALTRAYVSKRKLTVGYIRILAELVDTCANEDGNKFLCATGKEKKERVAAEREMTLKFEEVEELCHLKSVTEVPLGDPRYPSWLDDLERFGKFQEDYVGDIEAGRETKVEAEVVEKCEKQLLILEDLLIEKKAIVEESRLKKAKGKKSKK